MGRFGTFMGKVKLQLNFTKKAPKEEKKLSWIKRKFEEPRKCVMEWFNIAP